MKTADLEEYYEKLTESVRYGIDRLAELGGQLQHLAQDGARNVQKGLDSFDGSKLAHVNFAPLKKNIEEHRSAWIVAGAVAIGLVAGLLIVDSARRKNME